MEAQNFRENITLLLAIIGSAGTIAGWLFYWITHIRNLELRIIAFKKTGNIILAYISFENKSRLPISISDISIKVNDTYYPCRFIPQIVISSKRTSNGNTFTHDTYSIAFPINLGGLCSSSGYVLFVLPPDAPSFDTSTVIFQIVSNRGKAFEKKLSPPQTEELLL